MLLVIITVREEVFPESHCWALEECTMQAIRGAGWLTEPWVQKVVRLPPAEFIYHPGANPTAPAVDAPNFVLIVGPKLFIEPGTKAFFRLSSVSGPGL